MEKVYKKRKLDQISYPMGGFGTGMICLEGNGSIGKVSLHHTPEFYNEPNMFAAVTIKGKENLSRVLEGFVPIPKVYGGNVQGFTGSGNGMTGKNYGFPRFGDCSFTARFPFGKVSLKDEKVPFTVEIEGFSPFIPGNADDSSIPAASVTYTLTNQTDEELDGAFYYSALQFMGQPGGEEKCFVKPVKNGFVLEQEVFDDCPYKAGAFMISTDREACVNADFYRGGWWDCLTMRWNTIAAGVCSGSTAADLRSPGGAIEIPFSLKARAACTIPVYFTWYVPESQLFHYGSEQPDEKELEALSEAGLRYYRPWYAGKYASAEDVAADFTGRYTELYEKTRLFSNTLYESSLPDEIMDAVGANLTILKSTTVLRQTDGRFWAWEGSCDTMGSCHGSCTHVWNYAQALCHLFPELERTLREVEFAEDMDENGHQQFRTLLPIRKNDHDFHAASDGQLGGIMKMYREWKISGDTDWIASYWDRIVLSMEYGIRTWDKKEEGILREPHHNTYDIEFWGADGMCSSFYLGALKAISEIGKALDKDVSRYETLYQKGRTYLETVLFNGEYFIQIPEWNTLEAVFEANGDFVMEKEGPKYQYGSGCISDGVCGAWLAKECGLGDILDPEKTKSHLLSVYKYNMRKDLSCHANPQRPGYALWDEGGLLLCSWPYGGKPSIPFVYSDEVWTGIEYQVAAHLASFGYQEEALDIVSTLRARYDGEKRNPYDEYECGHWYARAMASYALLASYTGVRYDAVTKTLYAGKGDYQVFLAAADGYGLVSCKNGEVKLDVVSGEIAVEQIVMVG